ncbi:MAG: sensor histidine kinase [Gammaproteobacteria bacterium]|nr:sensor histidine kinase [Gammaproteobacteria bacterium]MBQ0773446.1 sensor histidine kinase [Gammaproteobacteria bacterium]
MLQKFRLCCLLLVLLPCWVAASEVVRPAPTERELSVGRSIDVLEDPDGDLTIEQVAGAFSDRFVSSQTENPSFGFSSSTFWLRITVDMSSVSGQRWFLIQRHPIIDHLTLYSPVAPGVWVPTEMGDALPFGQRLLEHREFIFPVNTGNFMEQTYYMKVSGKGALSLELKLSSAEGLIERTYREQLIFGLFYGALLVMLVYNFLLYFSVRDVAYLWYILFLSSFVLCFANINGLGLQYLWRALPSLNEWFPVFATFGMISLVQYSRAFLNLKSQFTGYEQGLKRLLYGCIAAFISVFIVPPPWSYHLSTLVVLLVAITLNWVGIGTWLRGYRAARFYVAAWSFFLLGCCIFVLDNTGIIPHSGWSNYAPHIGSAWVAILLSLALGERIKLLEAERDTLERQSHETLQHHLDEVQRLDRDKMVFLEYLSHELNTPLNWLSSARMLETGELPPELMEAVGMVHKGQDRLQQLVATSLRYFEIASRKEMPVVGQCAPMWKLDRIVRSVEREEELAAHSMKVRNLIPADLCVNACDKELTDVFSWLLDNAIHFGKEETDIVADAVFEPECGSVVLRITDQGRGILRDDIDGIFAPFYMVGSHHQLEGFGLSLPMARVMIEQAGGEIWAESEGREKGASLCIRLQVLAS